MANQINLQELLMSAGRGLAQKTGDVIGSSSALGQGTEQVLSTLSGLLNVAQQTNAMPQAQTQMPQIATDELNKVIKKFYKTKAEELISQPGGVEIGVDILNKNMQDYRTTPGASRSGTEPVGGEESEVDRSPYGTGTNPPTKGQMQGMGQQPASTQQPAQQQGPNILQQLLGGFMEGAAWGMAPEMMKTQAATRLKQQEMKQEAEQALQKFNMDLFLEDFKQGRLDQREVIKSQLDKGDFEALKDPSVFISNVTNMVRAFDEVPLKGRGTSMLGGVLAGTLGIGREERAKFDYWSEMLSYNIGGFVAGQLGRGLTENERELIKKAAIPKFGGGSGAFIGKIQGILDSANSILAEEGKPLLPDARTFLQTVRAGGNPIPEYTQNTQTQPGVKQAKQQQIGRFLMEVE